MSQITRRNLFKVGLGAAGAMVAQQALGQSCSDLTPTVAQPLGPFFPREGSPEHPVKEIPDNNLPIYLANDNDLTYVKNLKDSAEGQVVHIKGVLTDPKCKPLENATIIIWQASKTGRYNHISDGDNTSFTHPKTGKTIDREIDENFQYWGKATTNSKGEYYFKTIVPGFYPADLSSGNDWYRPPHIHFLVMAKGFENFVTQMYFKGVEIEHNDFIQELNELDLILQNPNFSKEDKDALVVKFNKDPINILNKDLYGNFNIQLK